MNKLAQHSSAHWPTNSSGLITENLINAMNYYEIFNRIELRSCQLSTRYGRVDAQAQMMSITSQQGTAVGDWLLLLLQLFINWIFSIVAGSTSMKCPLDAVWLVPDSSMSSTIFFNILVSQYHQYRWVSIWSESAELHQLN